MRRYDLGRLMEFARYVPGSSPLHRLHPGAKLLTAILGVSLLIAARGVAVLGLAFLLVVALTTVSRIPLSTPFRSLRRALPWLLIVILIQILTVSGTQWGANYGGFWIFQLRGGQVYAAIGSLLRFVDLILFLVLSISVTEAGELSYAADAVLTPFSAVGIPTRAFSLTLTIALYFLPLFATEADRIIKSQAARGADFAPKGFRPLGRIRTFAPLFVPLLVIALRHAENLARAMEARGYSPRGGHTRLAVHRLRWGSVAATLGVGALLVISLLDPLRGIDSMFRGLF